jgi:uroporphyrinogen decarboxylase
MITKKARVEAALRGEILDRPPYSFWTHFPGTDLDPAAIAATTAAFARELDIDLVKAMPNGFYCVEDWGVSVDYSAIAAGGVARQLASPVAAPEDWERLAMLDVTQGALGRELDHLRRLIAALGPDWPILATVFSPLTTAKKLGGAAFKEHLRTGRAALHKGLGTIAAVTAAFARKAIEAGCAGVFFAVQDATPASGEALYREFGVPYDEAALAGARLGWLNTVHMHGDAILFDLLSAYPVDCLNWHIGETAPSVVEYRASGGRKPILGGLRRMSITSRQRADIDADLAAARAANGARGIIFGPGCVIRHPVDRAFLKEIAAAICK